MSPPGRHREAFTISLRITHHVQEHLLRSPSIVLFVTNMRYHPLPSGNVKSMRDTILSLYHDLLTGSGRFPVISSTGYIFHTHQVYSPLPNDLCTWGENHQSVAPAGVIPCPVDTPHSIIFTPVHPERTSITFLRADHRNCVRNIEHDAVTFYRVICPVYDSEGSLLTNRWRVTDYNTEGSTLMSVFCKFTRKSVVPAKPARVRGKRKNKAEYTTPTKKPLRV